MFDRKWVIILLMLPALAILSGCKEDPCKKVDCGLHGTCDSGKCQCEKGFVTVNGQPCSQKIARLVEGVYQTSVSGCSTGNYAITLQGSNVFNDILFLVNLGGYTCGAGEELVVEAKIDSPEAFTLEEAVYCEKYKLSGKGTITKDEIRIRYDVEYIGSESSGTLEKEQCLVVLERT